MHVYFVLSCLNELAGSVISVEKYCISTPSQVLITAEGVTKALKSFPSGSAPGLSSFWASHYKETVFSHFSDPANSALMALLGWSVLCIAHQKWCLTFVLLPSLPARRRMLLSLWGRSCIT